MKTLIVDIGKYIISYSVVHELDNNLEMFKVDLMTLPDYLLSERGSSFIGKIIDTTRLTLHNHQPITKIIFTIPSKEVLLVSDKPMTMDGVLKEMKKEYLVTKGDKLTQAVGESYQYGKKYYTPVSVYDEALDMLLNELNNLDGEPELQGANKLRSDVYFQTSLGRMKQAVKGKPGKIAVVDFGFSTARVLLGDNGVPVAYREFDIMSGERMLEYIYANTEMGMTDIIGEVSNYNNLKGKDKEVIKLMDTFIVENTEPIKEYLEQFKLRKIYTYGGLSNADPLRGLKTPYEQVLLDENIYPKVPKHFLYKLSYNAVSTEAGTILDPENLDVLTGKSKYKKILTVSEIGQQKRRKAEEQRRQNDQKERPKDVEKAPKQSNIIQDDDVQITHPSQDFDDQDFENDIPEIEYQEPPKPRPRHPLEDVSEMEDDVVKKDVGSIAKEDDKEIVRAKKKYKRPSRREPTLGLTVTIVSIIIIAIATLLFMNTMGWIDVRAFELIGITSLESKSEVNLVQDSINSAIKRVGNKMGLPPTIQIQNKYSSRTRTLNTLIAIPTNIDKTDEIVERVMKMLVSMDKDGRNEITELDAADGFRMISSNIKFK